VKRIILIALSIFAHSSGVASQTLPAKINVQSASISWSQLALISAPLLGLGYGAYKYYRNYAYPLEQLENTKAVLTNLRKDYLPELVNIENDDFDAKDKQVGLGKAWLDKVAGIKTSFRYQGPLLNKYLSYKINSILQEELKPLDAQAHLTACCNKMLLKIDTKISEIQKEKEPLDQDIKTAFIWSLGFAGIAATIAGAYTYFWGNK